MKPSYIEQSRDKLVSLTSRWNQPSCSEQVTSDSFCRCFPSSAKFNHDSSVNTCFLLSQIFSCTTCQYRLETKRMIRSTDFVLLQKPGSTM